MRLRIKPTNYKYNSTFAIAKASITSILQNPLNIVLGILFPVAFILAFGFFDSNYVSVKLVLLDESSTDNFIYEELKNSSVLEIYREDQVENLDDMFKKGRVDALLTIVEFKEDKIVASLQTTAAQPQNGIVIQKILEGIIDKKNIEILKSESNIDVAPIQLTTREVKAREYKSIDFILPGQLGFSLLSTGVFGTAFLFLNLRQNLVLKRFYATPLNKLTIILGETIARLLFSGLQILIIILLGVVIFDFTLVNGVATLIEILVLCFLSLIVFLGFGFVVSNLASDEKTLPPLTNIITLPQLVLSGTFFPLDYFPEWVQLLSKLIPLTYLNEALRKVSFDGVRIWELQTEISALIFAIVITYLVALKIFKWTE